MSPSPPMGHGSRDLRKNIKREQSLNILTSILTYNVSILIYDISILTHNVSILTHNVSILMYNVSFIIIRKLSEY